MKTQFERIQPDANSSFRLIRNPRLSEVFLWHFHPEFELVYIEGTNGTRHVGDHISRYQYNDLVFIGSNIPHLNFDYGVKTDYEKVVLQFHPSFKQEFFQKFPELSKIYHLFEQSHKGIAFSGETKAHIGKRLLNFHLLNHFEQFIELLNIFQILSESAEFTLLHEEVYINQYSKKEQERLRRVYAFVEEHFQEKIEVNNVAGLCNLSKPAFCRYFKKATGQTFIGFLNQYRISQAKRLLLLGKGVGEACYESGFESLSYFHRTFKKVTKENPSTFRNRHLKRKALLKASK